MPPRAPRTFWQRCRIWFRRFRIAVWLGVLTVVGCGLYLNQIGLPGFLKRPLLEQLRQRGVELEFTRLRLLWYRGIVAENVRFGRTREASSPSLAARRAELGLEGRALLRGRLHVDALTLHAGRFEWPVAETNAPATALIVEDIEARVSLLPGDEWSVEELSARFAGARLVLTGTLTNATALRERRLSQPAQPTEPHTTTQRLRKLAQIIGRMSFATPPELRVFLAGDARDPNSFTARLTFAVPQAETPWGQVSGGQINARLFPATGSEHPPRAEVTLEAASARTPWAEADAVLANLDLGVAGPELERASARLELSIGQARTRWASLTNAQLTARWVHAFTNAIPLSGEAELRAAAATTLWGGGQAARVAVSLAAATNAAPAGDDWAWWKHLQPHRLEWSVSLGELQADKLDAGALACHGSWLSPRLVISNLSARLPGGTLQSSAQLDVATRDASFEAVSDFEPHTLDPWLTEKTLRWLGKYTWAGPPHIRGAGTVRLPAWTNRAPDWRGEVVPTLQLAGEFAITNGAYLGVAADWARSHVSYTNMIWRLPDLEVGRPEGGLRLVHQADDRTRDYYWRIHSTMDVRAFRPLLSTNAQRGFDLLTFTTPPVVDGEVWGRFHAYDLVRGHGHVALSNFTFRGEAIAACETSLSYSNRLLEFFNPRVWRNAAEHAEAEGVALDFEADRVFLTNVVSNVEPGPAARCIGPKTARSLAPYRFAQPPDLRLNGAVALHGNTGSDLRVDVAGGPFAWWKFNVPQISGTVFWRDQTVALTNVAMAFYGGEAWGWGVFDMAVEPGTDFRFSITATNAELRALIGDLNARTNRLEGKTSGTLTVTRANSEDWHSWTGYGDAQLRDGWIWEIPIFGVLSRPLDAVFPGLGNSRISEGRGEFILTNGVIYSSDLEMRALTMRLQYVGSVDLQGQVDATVQAELLRDTWVIGRLVSLALWPLSKMFEFKVTGALGNPQAEPLYIPKIFLTPLHPLRTLKGLMPENSANGTNAPPPATSP